MSEIFYEINYVGGDIEVTDSPDAAAERAKDLADRLGCTVQVHIWSQVSDEASYCELVQHFLCGGAHPEWWDTSTLLTILGRTPLERELCRLFPDEMERQEQLDTLVHECKAQEASNLLNDGIDAQLEFLSHHYASDEDLLKEFTR